MNDAGFIFKYQWFMQHFVLEHDFAIRKIEIKNCEFYEKTNVQISLYN